MKAYIKRVIILFCLSSYLTAYAAPPDIVYRAVMEGPDVVKQTGGFLPRGADGTRPNQPPPNISLYNHTTGGGTGLSRHDSGYVSTTTSFNLAHLWVTQNLRGNGYIYHIHPTGNFIDVNGTLRQFSPNSGEMEYASLGIIRWRQIIGWTQISFGVPGSFTPNRDYNRALYRTSHAGGSEPQLAGFPDNHIAWSLEPWRDYANCNQRLNNSCRPSEPSQVAGSSYYISYWRYISGRFILLYGFFDG